MEPAARKRKRVAKEEITEEPPQPTEEEVNEFFTILRRMRVAVKYFKDGGAVGDSSIGNVAGGGSGAAVMAAATEAGVGVGGRRRERRGIDLNSVPDSESNS